MRKALLLLCALLSLNAFSQTNLVPNGNFENWSSSSQPDSWYGYFSGILSQSSIAQNGSSSTNMKIATGTLNFMNSEFFPVTINKTYRITLYHKLVSGTFSAIDLSLYHKPGTFKSEIIKKTDATFSSSEWRKIEFEYTATVSENIEVDVWTTGTENSEILVDNVSVVDVADVPVQYTLIPDAKFEAKLIALGIDSGVADGKVLTSKINTLTSLKLDGSSITDLTGIQDFVALTSLSVYGNQLKSLDVSKNTALKSLNCGWNNTISTLDVSKNLSLTDLSCYYNKLTTLDVSKNTALTVLSCSANQLTSLDVSKNINLTTLACNSNLLTTVDTSNNLALTLFECFQNKITNLNLTKNSKLSNLECFSNSIASIDVSSNLALTTLNCQRNKLTNLDVSKNIKLTNLDVSFNLALIEINLKNGKNTLIKSTDLLLTGNSSLSCILVDDVAYANTNWASSKDASADFSSTVCTTPQYTLIPDANFEKSLIIKGIDGVEDGKVLTKRIATVTKLDLSDYYTNLSIKDLTGIQDFTDLEELKIPYNGKGVLTTIDVSKNLKLKKLDCYQNKLTAIDVSKNLALTELIISDNKITTLDVTKNLALTKLNCSINRLTTLDVSNNLALTSLSCAGSSDDNAYVVTGLLTSLDLSKNIALEYLDVSGDKKITGFDVSKNINLTSLSVNSMNFETIDFSANVNLTYLHCESNLLKKLDVTKYPKLEGLWCGQNSFTELDLSKLPSLKFLSSGGNNITNIDVSKNPLLERIYVTYNKLTTLDLSQNPNLLQVICNNNDLIKLNLKNGNNTKIDIKTYNSFANNPNLTCITVDDVVYSNSNWMQFKNSIASYNTECSFSLPSNNFTIETKGESCLGESNGELSIKGNTNLKYSADINGVIYPFPTDGSTLKVTKMAPGTYIVKITVNGETYEQTFNVTIAKAATITGKSSITAKKVTVEITEGTAPYLVFIDGAEQFKTNDASFTLDLKQGGLLEVKTAKACEGIYAKQIAQLEGNVSAYPNPTSGSFEIEIPNSKKEVAIELYNLGGQLISKRTYSNENGKAKLNLDKQPAGVYIAKVYLDTPEYLKIIKK